MHGTVITFVRGVYVLLMNNLMRMSVISVFFVSTNEVIIESEGLCLQLISNRNDCEHENPLKSNER